VIVPSLDDATAERVHPQPPFQDRVVTGKTLDLPCVEEVRFGIITDSNTWKPPVALVINGNTVECTWCPIRVPCLVSCECADETNANLEPFSRLPRLAQHLLHQRIYYPLFPPHPSVSLDLKRMDRWSMPCRPDVLILPSKLQCMAQDRLEQYRSHQPGTSHS
jgi:DNA polymerase alpha subunit B